MAATDPPAPDFAAYVAAAAPLLGLALDPPTQARIAAAMELVRRIAAPALDRAVPPEAEPAPIFRP